MMTVADIESWVRGGESETLDLKRTTGERREAARTICAMLNHRGGRVIGQMVSDRTVEEVAQELGEIEPPVFPSIERVDFAEGRQLLVVTASTGSGQTEFLDNRQFHGNAFDLLLKAERFLRENLPVAGRIQPNIFERIDDPLYPPVALREALANAFCHRDYSIGGGSISLGVFDDRLEITSTGTLHFGLTPEALYLPHESLPWNPLIARVFYRRGIIEAWGRGTIRMGELTVRAGLASPEIIEAGGCVTVRFSPTRYVPPQRAAQNVTERQQRVLAVLSTSAEGMALRDLRKGVGEEIAEWEVKNELAALKHLGLVQTKGYARGARWILS